LGTVRLPPQQEYVPLDEIWQVLLHPALGAALASVGRAGTPGWLRGKGLGGSLPLTIGDGGGGGDGKEPFPLLA